MIQMSWLIYFIILKCFLCRLLTSKRFNCYKVSFQSVYSTPITYISPPPYFLFPTEGATKLLKSS